MRVEDPTKRIECDELIPSFIMNVLIYEEEGYIQSYIKKITFIL